MRNPKERFFKRLEIKLAQKSYQVFLLLGLAKILVWWQNQVIASNKNAQNPPSKTPKPKCVVWIAMQVLELARNDKMKGVKEVKLFFEHTP